MPSNKQNYIYNLALLAGSLFLCLLLFLLGEILVRKFSDVNYFGNSSNLFIANAYVSSIGNSKNSEGESFGKKIYTDKYGFRIDKDVVEDQKYENSILILGDSVSFGPGDSVDKIFAGLLQKNYPLIKVYFICNWIQYKRL